jgi:Carboxypeptidase regulatory-like domain
MMEIRARSLDVSGRTKGSAMSQAMGRRGRFLPLELLLALTLMVSGVPSRSQEVNATLGGEVKDATAAVIPGATVTVTNASTGVTARTTSGPNGNFIFPSLAPGTYTLSAERGGFNTALISGITLTV